jgi:hypothetical protein
MNIKRIGSTIWKGILKPGLLKDLSEYTERWEGKLTHNKERSVPG